MNEVLPIRRVLDRAVALVSGLPITGANVDEWGGYALEKKWREWVVVQPVSEEVAADDNDQDEDACFLTIQVISAAATAKKRDAVHLEVRAAMARARDEFEYQGTTFSSPEIGAHAIFEASSTYRVLVFHGQDSPADER